MRSDYDDISPAAIKTMHERAVGLQVYWDPASEGFKKWETTFHKFDPAGEVRTHTQPRAYDALMLLVLALTKANSTDGEKIKSKYYFVANPPGEVVYPGEFAKARRLLFEGKDINYEGASGSCDLDETNNVKTTPYQVWGVDADGVSELREVFESAE